VNKNKNQTIKNKMPTKNRHYIELRRYLAEVSSGAKKLRLEMLAERVYQAQQHNVPSLDICDAIKRYAQSSDKGKSSREVVLGTDFAGQTDYPEPPKSQQEFRMDRAATPLDNDRSTRRFLERQLKKL
jgi:hypothetical protein